MSEQGRAPTGKALNEQIVRRAGLLRHAHGRAQSAPPDRPVAGHRHIRSEARRRLPDVEPVHGERGRARQSGARRSRCGRARRGGRRPRSWLHRARGAGRSPRQIGDGGRCARRGHRLAPARAGAVGRGASRRPAMQLRERGLLRAGDVTGLRSRSQPAAAALSCDPRRYRSFTEGVAEPRSRLALHACRNGEHQAPSSSGRNFCALVQRSAG